MTTDGIKEKLDAHRQCDRCVEDYCQAFGGDCECRCHREQDAARARMEQALLAAKEQEAA